MPRRSRIDLLTSAVSASESSACLGDDDCLGQSAHVHVGFVPASYGSRRPVLGSDKTQRTAGNGVVEAAMKFLLEVRFARIRPYDSPI